MARITIEDCLENIPNHFKLVLVASHRARQLHDGAAPKVEDAGGEKPNIVALREIAAGVISEDILDEPLIKDPAADEELADLIAHGLMNQDVSPELGDMAEDLEENDGEDAGIEMDPLEEGTETIESMEKIADLNLDHLKVGDETPGEDVGVQTEASGENEAAAGDKFLSSMDEAFGTAESAVPEPGEGDAESAQESGPAEEKPA